MLSGECVLMMLKWCGNEHAYKQWRQLIGSTDPLLADEGTLRHLFGISIHHNAVHGSDSPESAKKELNIFFT